jgi:PucR family transcriptional regulator, purine catabolism regulatory protein
VLRRALPEVVAGEGGLDRAVRWVHVVDVPNPDELLRGGELVLSTGAGPGPEPQGQRTFVRSLAAQKAAGLLIEIGYSYKQALPPTLIREADALGLPLIATHRPTRFVDITEGIHSALVDRRLGFLRRAGEAGDRLTELVLERRELAELLAELARALRNPVTLENVAGQLVSYATHEAGEQALLEAHMEYRRSHAPGELHGHGWLGVEVISQGQVWGQITAHELDGPLVAEDAVVLQRGAQAVALRLMHEQRGEQLRGSFLAELLEGRVAEADAERRARALDFARRPDQRLLTAALGWRSHKHLELTGGADSEWGPLVPSLRAALGLDRSALLGLHDGSLLIICAVGREDPGAELLDSLAADLRQPLERRGLGLEDAAIAFGGSDETWVGAGRRLERAAASVLAARAGPPVAWRDARRNTLVDLLYALHRRPELLRFAREQLGPLFEVQAPRERELLHTLEVYLDSGARKAEAARALDLERQSLYLRLERLEQLLDADLDSPETRLALHLAVRTLRLTQVLDPEERL